MLALTFKEGETLHIGDDITIKISRPHDRDDFGYSNQVKLAVDAPAGVLVLREELVEQLESNRNMNQGEMS